MPESKPEVSAESRERAAKLAKQALLFPKQLRSSVPQGACPSCGSRNPSQHPKDDGEFITLCEDSFHELGSCDRCNKEKHVVMVATGFAGESEGLCGECVSEEYDQMETALREKEREIERLANEAHDVTLMREEAIIRAEHAEAENAELQALIDDLREKRAADWKCLADVKAELRKERDAEIANRLRMEEEKEM